MTTASGYSTLMYEPLEGWAKLPIGWSFLEVSGIAFDNSENVYVLTRGQHPVVVFDREGNFLRSWGYGLLRRPHAIHISPDNLVYCADDDTHTVRKFSLDGQLLLTFGSENHPAPRWSGAPFNKPTHVAVSPRSGDVYITDGYGNSRVHKFSPDGRHLLSWGEPGIDPGQFIRPHNVVIDMDENIYVADRECHRIQIFNGNGDLQAIWQNIYRPNGLCLDHDGNVYVAEFGALDSALEDCPGLGHRVSVLNREGQLIGRFGSAIAGEGPGEFIAPHGLAVDSRGDLYVGEHTYSAFGSKLTPPREVRSLQKFQRRWAA